MALLSSPLSASSIVHQSNAPPRTASLSETQLGPPAGGPSLGSTNGHSTGRPLIKTKNGRPSPQENNGLEIALANGHAAGHVASSKPNHESFEPHNIARARSENQQTLAHRPKSSMTRSKTNYEPELFSSTRETSGEEHGELRHGWEDEYNSSEFLKELNSV